MQTVHENLDTPVQEPLETPEDVIINIEPPKRWQNLTTNQKRAIIASSVVVFLMFCIGIAAFNSRSTTNQELTDASPTPSAMASPTPSLEPSPSPTPSPTAKPSVRPSTSPKATPRPSPSPTPTIQPTPTPTQTPAPTPTPRTANPPRINISYPAENQVITMNSSQTFCVVDTPGGGDTSGLQRKHSLNTSSWTEYAPMTTLCFNPAEGANTLKLRYKNSYNEESEEYVRNFIFHRQ